MRLILDLTLQHITSLYTWLHYASWYLCICRGECYSPARKQQALCICNLPLYSARWHVLTREEVLFQLSLVHDEPWGRFRFFIPLFVFRRFSEESYMLENNLTKRNWRGAFYQTYRITKLKFVSWEKKDNKITDDHESSWYKTKTLPAFDKKQL